MPVNWKDPNAFTRLLAAMVAAQDMKLDYRKIATMYGQGATYDSIEGRFRIIKKEAAAMKAEIDSGERAEAPARGAATSAFATPKKPKSAANTPKTKNERIIGGRVTKGNGFGTPSKKRGNGKGIVKAEPSSSTSTSPFHQTPTPEDVEPSSSSYESAAAIVVQNGGKSTTVLDGDDELALFYDNDNNDFVDNDGMDLEAF